MSIMLRTGARPNYGDSCAVVSRIRIPGVGEVWIRCEAKRIRIPSVREVWIRCETKRIRIPSVRGVGAPGERRGGQVGPLDNEARVWRAR